MSERQITHGQLDHGERLKQIGVSRVSAHLVQPLVAKIPNAVIIELKGLELFEDPDGKF